MAEWSIRRLNRVVDITHATSYLEVGVDEGKTISRVSIPFRAGVDPRISKVRDLDDLVGIKWYNMTSDDFFAMPRTEKYDVIFLDGLHTSEQTFRDFCNSLCVANHGTVWLIDDVLPNSPYNALRSQDRARRLRDVQGIEDKSWHGDVFRVVLLLRTLFPTFAMCTLTTGGNAQSLVWRSPTPQSPLDLTFDEISKFDYFDLLDDLSIMNPVKEEEAFDMILSDFHHHSEV
jgi:hypothetical protein